MIRILHTSAHDLHDIEDGSVQMIATSPPFYGLRSYAGDQDVEWPTVTYRLNEWCEPVTVPPMTCALGLEPSPVAYIGHLILCLREWRRVLRDDGVAFINLGDSYNSGTCQGNQRGILRTQAHHSFSESGQMGKIGRKPITDNGLKPKDLLLIPHMFAFAARADGWWLRSDVIWSKPNPMPESVTDRPTKAHEYIFLLAKSQRYYWDSEAVRENTDAEPDVRLRSSTFAKQGQVGNHHQGAPVLSIVGRNIRTVWTIATQPYAAAHYAVWPERLVEPMIKASTSERGACSAMITKLKMRDDLTEVERAIVTEMLQRKGLL